MNAYERSLEVLAKRLEISKESYSWGIQASSYSAQISQFHYLNIVLYRVGHDWTTYG